MRLCHEPWLVAHWFFPVKRWRKKNSVFFFFFFFFCFGYLFVFVLFFTHFCLSSVAGGGF